MTRFLHVDPAARTVTPVLAADPHKAIPSLTSGNVDHGVVSSYPGVGIIVYEYGLVEGDGPYFELRGRLYSGDAILYGFSVGGDTIDMDESEDFLIAPRWLPTREDVELAIAAGVVARPQTSVNGAVLWQWGR